MKGTVGYDENPVCLPRQHRGMKALEGNYCDKLRQIDAIGLDGYYGFTTNDEFEIYNVKGE